MHPDLRVRACRYLACFRRFGQANWRNSGRRTLCPARRVSAFVGKPVAHEFEVTNSTWYKIHAA
jgi:hypothetical protein